MKEKIVSRPSTEKMKRLLMEMEILTLVDTEENVRLL